VQFPILAWISSLQFFSIVRSATASAPFHILIARFARAPSVLKAFSVAAEGFS